MPFDVIQYKFYWWTLLLVNIMLLLSQIQQNSYYTITKAGTSKVIKKWAICNFYKLKILYVQNV